MRIALTTAMLAAGLMFVAVSGTHGAPQTVAAPATQPAGPSAGTLPDRLSDQEYWSLLSSISEPGGYFRIVDNFTSNENEVGRLFSGLEGTGVKGGVYMGVGPEQNLSYIAAVHPAMAFVCDIRRQAVMQHLMFKAVFEMSKDRADFISVLFSKPRPAGLDADTPIQKIWDAFWPLQTDIPMMQKNHAAIVDRLTKTHRFALTPDELEQLNLVIDAFGNFGPSISTNSGTGTRGVGVVGGLSFADLTGWSTDDRGVPQSFLSTDEHFQFVKSLQDRNLVVPVSGDFGGPKAIRAIGDYVRSHGSTISAFYLSNVEQYLFGDGKQLAFYANVAALPLSPASVFIRPYSLRRPNNGAALCGISKFLDAVKAGRVQTNNDALACPQ